ncbi:hypothetical protein [Vibrio phage Va2]|nr:hypothetical protein [Vibrio phage Va2]
MNPFVTDAKNDIKGLVAYAKEQATMYYNEGESEISDEKFDLIIEAIREVNPEEPILFQTGWGLETDDSFYPHSELVTGLDDNKFENREDEWFSEWQYAMAKYDGLTGVAYYRYGKLSKVLTRGDGESGKDITKMAISTEQIPLEIDNKSPLYWVRGELVMSYAVFEAGAANKLWKEDSHPRNVAAGAMNGSDEAKAKWVDFIVFETSSNKEDFHNRMMEAASQGFTICQFKQVMNKVEVGNFYESYVQCGDYPIDGVVVHVDVEDNRLKAKVKFPATQIEEMEVRLVEWRMKRTGKLTPRVHFRHPKFISGCWFRKATGNNAAWITNRGIGRNAIVRVQRANEVIPNILDETALFPVDEAVPTHCPECQSELKWHKSDLMCMNDECSAKKGEISYRIFSQAVPKGAGGSFIENVLDWIDLHYGDTSPKNVLQFTKDVYNGSISLSSVMNTEHKQSQLKETCRSLVEDEISIETILWIMNMRTWGSRKCNKYATELRSWFEQGMNSFEAINKMYEDYLPESRKSEWFTLFSFFHLHKVIPLKNEEPEPEVETPADAVIFGLTGKLNGYKKQEFADLVSGKAIWDDKQRTILVTDSERESAKMKKAKAEGVPVMTSAEFLKHIGV